MIRVERVDAAVTRELRFEVLRPGRPAGTPVPGDVDGAIHLGAYDGDTVVGAVALLREPFALRPVDAGIQLSGMAVDADHRNGGVGGALLDAVLGVAAELGIDVVWCNARVTAQAFYERHGYVIEGDEFVTPATGLPHLLMWREVGNRNATPSRP